MKGPTTSTPSSSASASQALPLTDSGGPGVRGPVMALYACTIFVSAFLLFQVQPIIAKMILPWFGGSAGVWTVCMLFFQLLLLGGYLYSHASIRSLQPSVQAYLHIGLLALAALVLPVVPDAAWKPTGGEDPTLRILGLLAVTIGLPYFLLSTTGPLVQAWFARESATASKSAYRLYSLSNVGSMLALLTYPVAIEPYLPSRNQAQTWSVGFGVFAVLCAALAWRARKATAPQEEQRIAATTPPPSAADLATWAGLAACASTLLLGVTNHLTQNVAAVPFLWVLPLSLYLLTFILCFDSEGWYKRDWFVRLFAVAVGSVAYAMYAGSDNMPLKVALPLFGTALFICCMVCHGELVRLKPDPSHLTLFYVMVSVGGALGGLFVGLLAPRLFPGYFELQVGLVATSFLVLYVLRRDPNGMFRGNRQPEWIVASVLVLALTGYLTYETAKDHKDLRLAVRNFYGGMTVKDYGKGETLIRTLTHGTINHGEQYLHPSRRRRPITYYSPNTGVGLAILETRQGPQHIGVIGLGTGSIAVYGRPGDRIRYYEINPLVIGIANNDFSYIKDNPGETTIELGDARLCLEREPPQNFDVLAVDAFSSDSIPVHLLTLEAFELYRRHLKPNGVLAVHVSNKFLELKPITEMAGRALGFTTRYVDTDDDEEDEAIFGTTWVIMSSNAAFFERPAVKAAALKIKVPAGMRMWTDDFSNLYRSLK